MNAKPKSSSAAARLKAAVRVSALLSSGSKTSGQPPAIHPPWNKARVRPVEEGEGGGDRLEGRKGEGVGGGLERGEAGKRENKGGGRDEAAGRGGRGEIETWGRGNRGGVMNYGMRHAVEGGEGVRPEHRGELPGLLSSGRFASVDGGMVIDGSYFQTSVEASKPPPMKQKLSEALSLISLARRLQGPARVGDEQWSHGKSWDRGEENIGKTNGSIGDMSVSASVSEREERRRWERQLGDENSSSEVWWKREKRFYDSDSETGSGSKDSPSEYSPSDPSSPASSVTAEHDKTESDTETEKNESDSGTEREEGTPDTGRESESGSQDEEEEGSESERESGLESEDEGKESSRKRSKGSISNSSASVSSKRRSGSANVKRQTAKETRSSSSRPRTSRHSRSSHETIEEEDEESGEEEARSVRSRKSSSSGRATSHSQSDIGSGVMDASDDLSPIIEDTEEEERSSGHGGGEGGEDEEEGDLENESAD